MNNFLLALLKSLTAGERQELELFLKAEWHNGGFNRDRLQQLYELLMAAPEPPGWEALFGHLYPGAQPVAGKLEKLMSELSVLVRQFLLIRHYNQENFTFQQLLDWAVILRRRGIMNRYPQHFGRAEKWLEEHPAHSPAYYQQHFQLAYETHEMESQYNRFKGDLALPEAIARLDAYYMAQRLELMNQLAIQQKFIQVDLPDWLEANWQPPALPQAYQEQAAYLTIALAIHQQLSAAAPSAEAVRSILLLLQTHEDRLDAHALQQFYGYLRNLCVLLSNRGDQAFLSILHDIQKDNLLKGYLLYEGKLAPSTYQSVAVTAIKTGHPEWALSFVEQYRHILLAEDDAENFYCLNKAQCLFHLKAFEAALEILPASFSDLGYLIQCKRLELKLYYELDSDLLEYKIDAYKMYLSRASKKTLAENTRDSEANFLNLLIQICRCMPGDAAKAQKIAARIAEKTLLPDRVWLLEKAAHRGASRNSTR